MRRHALKVHSKGRGYVNEKLAGLKAMVNAGYHKTIFPSRRDYQLAVDPKEGVTKRSPATKKGIARFDLSKHTTALPPQKTAWQGAKPKTADSVAAGSAVSLTSPNHDTKSNVPTVDEASDLVVKTLNALEVTHCETVSICENLLEPLRQYMAQGDLVQQLNDRTVEVN